MAMVDSTMPGLDHSSCSHPLELHGRGSGADGEQIPGIRESALSCGECSVESLVWVRTGCPGTKLLASVAMTGAIGINVF